jgi:hypothetical protein
MEQDLVEPLSSAGTLGTTDLRYAMISVSGGDGSDWPSPNRDSHHSGRHSCLVLLLPQVRALQVSSNAIALSSRLASRCLNF